LSEQQAYRKTRAGTNNWVSPEIVDGKIYSKEIDIWAFGAFIHELGKGEPPFLECANEESLFTAIAEKPI
jgi:serine/threonine protein kinase